MMIVQSSIINEASVPGVAVSAYPPFSIPGSTLKLVSAYRRYVERTPPPPPDTLKLELPSLVDTSFSVPGGTLKLGSAYRGAHSN